MNKVSIICTTYNHEPYIRQALEGFVMQQCNFPFEIVVHDDASTDRTADIIREYEAKYPQLFRIILQTENQYSKGVNIWEILFLDSLCADYIAICEGDDYWIDPLKLQKQVDFLEANSDYSMCFHNAVKYYDCEKPSLDIFNNYNSDRDLTLHDAISHWVVPTASVVGRKKWMSVYPEWLCHIYSGDYSLILIMFNSGRIRYLNNLMSVYRIKITGTSASALMLKRNVFMLEQKILLLESFNEGTKRIYAFEIDLRIKYLKKELEFQRRKENHNLFLMLGMRLFWSKLISKIFR